MKLSIRELLSILLPALALVFAPGGGAAYRNPVIHADYSDPDAIRVGDDYYMTASSFANTPGLPLLHSTDLVNWELIGHALKAVPPTEYYDAAPRHGKGVWAPSIRHHDGSFYIYWGDPDFGIFMVKADDIRGPWSQPVLVKGGKGMIDPVPLWDDDGRLYLAHAWAGSRIGFNSVVTLLELSPDGSSAISDPVMIFDANDGVNHTMEGPKLYKRNGWYYMFAPAGGVVDGWQVVMRSRDILGPYESKIVMAQGSTPINGPHQGALIEGPDGRDWFLHFQDKGPYGRVSHLNPVTWHDGWPVIGRDSGSDTGEPFEVCPEMPLNGSSQNLPRQIKDSFSSPSLAPQWEWAANYLDWYGFPTSLGFFRLNSAILENPSDNLWTVPNLLLQKFPAEAFTVTAELSFNCKANTSEAKAGLLLFGYDYAWIGVEKKGGSLSLVEAVCPDSDQGAPETVTVLQPELKHRQYEAGLYPNQEVTLWLRAKVSKGAKAEFFWSLDGKKYHRAPESFQCRQGKWVGAKTGLFCTVSPGQERAWLNIEDFTIDFK